jgi:hypothetical protein
MAAVASVITDAHFDDDDEGAVILRYIVARQA